MGLIKAIINATSGTLADQWVDFITCDSLSNEVLFAQGTRPTQSKSSNTKYSENIITNGSKINVADGQCMLICEDGKIVDVCATPGQYIYDSTTQPSILGGGLKDLSATFQQIGKRFAAGGAPTSQQMVYYVNTKEIIDNKIGMGNIPFRDSEFQMTVSVRGFGKYSFKIMNPMLFYTNIVGNRATSYTKELLASQMKSELVAALNPALGKIARQKVSYDELINYPKEIGMALNEEMSSEWREKRGIEVVSLAIESIDVDDKSRDKIMQLQEARAFSNPGLAAGRLVAGQANAMEDAAKNTNGAMNAFMGMGMAQNSGGMNASNLFSMQNAQPQQPQQPQQQETITAPKSMNTWNCPTCHKDVDGKFCSSCGASKPESSSWTCKCGNISDGKFCSSCGTSKMNATGVYKCDKCGWVPDDAKNPPKFCPECGDTFDANDLT